MYVFVFKLELIIWIHLEILKYLILWRFLLVVPTHFLMVIIQIYKIYKGTDNKNIQIVKLYVDRADTIFNCHLPSFLPSHHRKLFSALEVTYTQVWYIVGIVSSSPTHFHSEKIGLIGVTIDPLSTVGLIWHSEGTYSEVWYIIGNVCSNPTHFCT